MPTRHIKTSPVKVTGTVPDGQQFESTLEEDFFILLRFNPLVASFEAQPIKVEWQDDNGNIHKYTPDVLVHYRQDLEDSSDLQPVLCEIKPLAPGEKASPKRRQPPRRESDAESKLKWAAAERLAARNGWQFRVYFEKDIRTPYLENARFLLRYLEKMHDSKYQGALLAELVRRGPLTLRAWAASVGNSPEEQAYVLPACYRLIALQQVDVDLQQKLTLQSLVKPICHV